MLDTLNPEAIICAFCEGFIANAIDYSTTQYCGQEGSEGNCNEYKGVITVREYMEVFA